MKDKAPPLSIYIDNDLPFSLRLQFFLALDNLYNSLSGDHLEATNQGTYNMSLESKTCDPSLTTHYIPRNEVYETITELAKPEKRQEAIDKINNIYPRDDWGDNFPDGISIEFLLNQCRDCFKTTTHPTDS